MGETIKTKTLKILLYTDDGIDRLFGELTKEYSDACNFVSGYVFENGYILNFMELQKRLYDSVRNTYRLKSQMTISALKTVTARYKTVKEQLFQKPFRYKDENGEWQHITRTLEWLQKPVCFARPQADLVRGRDYSFVDGGTRLSINTLEDRVKVGFCIPDVFSSYFDGTWSFGTGKLVKLRKNWYFHIPVSKEGISGFDDRKPSHVVGIDRGLRFLTVAYDEKGKTSFQNGRDIIKKRMVFLKTRAELQSRGTKSAKRALKRISGRENRWMSDINHQISKTLVNRYGRHTLFVIEDLRDVSFDGNNLGHRNCSGRNELRSWSFYQLEMFLKYKAELNGSGVIKVAADYTSQRCPKCGRIHKENRHHETHEYICDACGYRSNDDRVGAMNIYNLGTLYVSGDSNPRYGARKKE